MVADNPSRVIFQEKLNAYIATILNMGVDFTNNIKNGQFELARELLETQSRLLSNIMVLTKKDGYRSVVDFDSMEKKG